MAVTHASLELCSTLPLPWIEACSQPCMCTVLAPSTCPPLQPVPSLWFLGLKKLPVTTAIPRKR